MCHFLRLRDTSSGGACRFCMGVLELDSERALLGRNHNLVLAGQPADSPVKNGCLAVHLFLVLREGQLTSVVEGVPDNSSGGSNFFLHHHSPCRRKHECLVSQVAATADGSQARAALARTGTFLLITAALSSVISSMPSLSVAFTLSGSIWQGRSNTRKTWFERRSEKMVSPSFCSDASCRLPVMHTERGATRTSRFCLLNPGTSARMVSPISVSVISTGTLSRISDRAVSQCSRSWPCADPPD